MGRNFNRDKRQREEREKKKHEDKLKKKADRLTQQNSTENPMIPEGPSPGEISETAL